MLASLKCPEAPVVLALIGTVCSHSTTVLSTDRSMRQQIYWLRTNSDRLETGSLDLADRTSLEGKQLCSVSYKTLPDLLEIRLQCMPVVLHAQIESFINSSHHVEMVPVLCGCQCSIFESRVDLTHVD